MGTNNNLPSVTPIESEPEYNAILQRAVSLIEEARTTIARNVSQSVNSAHYQIGKLLHERKLESSHGSRVVKRLSVDLKKRYPKMGVSPRNLWDMKRFYERYQYSDPKVRRSVALLPWSHNILLINKKLGDNETSYYAEETIKEDHGVGSTDHFLKFLYYTSFLTPHDPGDIQGSSRCIRPTLRTYSIKK